MKVNGRGATRSAIAGAALLVGVATGGVWGSGTGSTTPAPEASGCYVVAGRAGTLPCVSPYANDPQTLIARRVAGRVFVGCVLGVLAGPEGWYYGCLGGLAANIPW